MPLTSIEATLAASRCRVWPYDLRARIGPEAYFFDTYKGKTADVWVKKTRAYLDQHAQLPGWLLNQYSAELWLQHALINHPWLASSAEEADGVRDPPLVLSVGLKR